MEVSSDFAEYLNSQTKKFKSAVMREYLKYRHNPGEKSGFPFFDIASDDFYKQKHFELVIEDCVRRYLVNGFLGRVLEARGNGIYPPRIPEKLENAFVHVTNREFEELVPWEFCGDFLTNKRIVIRYTDTKLNEISVSEDIDEVIIINWETIGINGKDKVCRGYSAGKPIMEYSLWAFFVETGFSENEFNTYWSVLNGVIMDAVDLVGIRSTLMLTSATLSEFRFELEKTILNQVEDWRKYRKTEEDFMRTRPSMVKDFTWAYSIIENENKVKYPKLEADSKELLFTSGALKTFVNKKYYLALIGRSDYAMSFETSEYLYRQHDAGDNIDYTAIISGYLKSVEQLLYKIVMLSIDKKCKIKRKGGDRYSKEEFSSENLDNCDTTLGPLIYFLTGNSGVLRIEPKYKNLFFNCLMTYVNECRNESFHKHNINCWSRVEFVRKNTFLVYVLLLGCCRLASTDRDTDKYLGIVRDDRMERAFNWIINIPQEEFYLEFEEDKKPVQVKFGRNNEFPNFDQHGFIKDYMFLLDCPELIDPVVHKPEFTVIKRDRLPERMWYIDKNGKRVDFK